MKIEKNIVLTGMRGSGKSTIGKLLSKILGRPLVDSDVELEKCLGMSIREIVKIYGWDYFRMKEREQILSISQNKTLQIISTGGGVILNNKNIEILKNNGLLVFINTPVDILKKRLQDCEKRPSLTGQDPLDEMYKIWEKREELYLKSADYIYNKNEINITSDDAENIIELIKSK